MNTYDFEFKQKKLIELEKDKMVFEFEKNVGKKPKFIDRYKFRAFLTDWELKKLQHFSFEQKSLIVKSFYKYYQMPFFNADLKNLEKNCKFILDNTIPLILVIDEIPKSKISKTIFEKLDLTINEHLSFKDKEETSLIKQICFRNIFENFLHELKVTPTNTVFVR